MSFNLRATSRRFNRENYVLRQAFGVATLLMATLFALSFIMNGVVADLGLIQHTHSKVIHQESPYLWISIYLPNLFLSLLFFLAGRLRIYSLFYVLIFLNLMVWSTCMSLIVPWMQTTADWISAIWLCLYIWLEIFSYLLTYYAGRHKRVYLLLAPPMLLAIAAYLEKIGMKWFG